MFSKPIIKQGLMFSGFAFLYVALIITGVSIADKIFIEPKGIIEIIAPMAGLLLFVTSAATMGMLVFGKPVMLYLDGKKRDAIALITCTIGSLACYVILLLVLILVLQRFI